jgi:hypothetical protein
MKNTFYLVFKKEELFNLKALEKFVISNPLKKAELISEVLMNYFIISNDVIYLYNPKNITYKVVNQPSLEYLATIMRKLIINSYENLTNKKKQYFEDNIKDFYKLDYFKDFVLDVYNLLVNDYIVFDKKQKHIIHYNNGYYNAEEDEFYNRNYYTDFITKYKYEDCFLEREEDEEDEDIVACENLSEDEYSEDEVEEEEDKSVKQFTPEEIKKVIDFI